MATKRLDELVNRLRYYRDKYTEGHPLIDDSAYDALEEELRRLDPGHPFFQEVGSITSKDQMRYRKIQHRTKMLSLQKVYTIEELEAWRGSEEVLSTYKIDGVSCSLLFHPTGHLMLAKTRGDGEWGEDITDKMSWVQDIPFSLGLGVPLEIRGELYCPTKVFQSLQEEMRSRNLPVPSSPRNSVAGLLGRKDHLDLAKYIHFLAFDLMDYPQELRTEHDKLQLLQSMGFACPNPILHQEKESFLSIIEQTKKLMESGQHQIDGLVFTFNNLKLHDRLGFTSHHPRFKMAFKFQSDTQKAITTIQEIEWSLSRQGILTPVAIVAPVYLSGATIARVTLHHAHIVESEGLFPGVQIEIIRSGEVIPKFLKVIHRPKDGSVSLPIYCPSCGSKLIKEELRLICSSSSCSAQALAQLVDFVKKIGIEDLGEQRLAELFKRGLATEPHHLFLLTKDDFLQLPKVKDKLAEKLCDHLNRIREGVPLKTLLLALGIRHLGEATCEDILQAGHDHLNDLFHLEVSDFMAIEGIGEKSAKEIRASLHEVQPQIEKLLRAGLKILAVSKKEKAKDPLGQKRVCITGELSRPRKEMKKLLEERGLMVEDHVSQGTDYLLTNEEELNLPPSQQSSKMKKARKLGIPVVLEKDLL